MDQVLYTLPDGWRWQTLIETTLKAKADIVDGPFGSNLKASEYVSEGVPILRLQNVDRLSFINKNIQFITKEKAEQLSRHSYKVGDIVITKLGAPLGKACIVPDDFEDGRIVADIVRARINEDAFDKRYICYAINSSVCVRQLESQTKGATRPRVNLSHMRGLILPVAPIAEQKRIVEKLDALLTRIAIAIEHLQESVTLAAALSKNGLSEIFEGLKDSYEVVPLSSVVKINSGIALPKLFKNGFSDGDIPFFKVAQMNNHHENMVEPEITFNEIVAKEHKVKLFPKGSTLIPKRGGAILTNKKRMLLEDASYDSNIMGLKADESKISDDYLFAFMRTIDLANFVDASTIPQVNNKHIDQMQIPLASIEEQAYVVSRVNLLVKKVETMNSEIQRQLDDLQSLKNSILDSAFKGEL